jgi:hypothetical protein
VSGQLPSLSSRARYALAAIVAVHGLAHGAGVAVNLTLAQRGGTAELFGGWWPTNDTGVLTAAAVVWGALGVTMLLASALVLAAAHVARTVLRTAATSSLIVCTMSLPAAEVGVAINLGLLAAALALGGSQFGHLAGDDTEGQSRRTLSPEFPSPRTH